MTSGGAWAAMMEWTDSGQKRVTRPAPEWRAPRDAKVAAPVVPGDPASRPIRPVSDLWVSKFGGGRSGLSVWAWMVVRVESPSEVWI